MTLDNIKNYIRENFLILLSALFFIFWKFYLISIFLKNTLNNDASVYIHHINTISSCPSVIFCKEFLNSFHGYGGFEHLTYKIFFGIVAHIFNLSSSNIFLLSFYIGTLILIPALILFLKNINPDKNIIALSLFFLALFSGSGSYHGFFWVVPSFFALLLFFVIFSIIIGNYKYWKAYLFFLIPLMIYTHFLGLYLISIIVIFFFIYSFFTKKINRILAKKVLFSILVILLFYIPTACYLKDSVYGGNPYGIESLIKNSGKNALPSDIVLNINNNPHNTLSKILPGFKQISTDYFDWIFPNTLALIPFFITILILIYYKQYIVLSIFFSSAIFTLATSINIFSVRSLILLWPLTYVLYAYSTWFGIKFINDTIKNKILNFSLKGMMLISVIFFILINTIYSYSLAKDIPISIKAIIKEII